MGFTKAQGFIVLSLVVAVSSVNDWSGRYCCSLPLATDCQAACQRAHSRSDVEGRCRQSDELAFYSCLERQEVSATCCGSATSSQCRAVCRAIFISDSTPSRAQRETVMELCNLQVAGCVHNYTKTTPVRNPAESLPCCDKSPSRTCKDRCHQVLQTMTVEEEIVDELIKACGTPFPSDPVWQCFLKNSGNNKKAQHPSGGTIDTTGIDGAKLFCCAKGKTRKCRDLCVRTYSRGWTDSWTEFHQECQYHPSEGRLNSCLQEVDEPCQLGCTALNYCTHFNHRPTQLFRSCNARADAAAENDIRIWKKGAIPLPGRAIPVRNIGKCKPEMWKAIACALQLKPCHSRSHTTSICKRDCVSILSQCIDYQRLPKGLTVTALCSVLSPQQDWAPCVSLAHYLEPSPHKSTHLEVSHPCKPNPCNSSSICVVNRRKCKHPNNCKTFLCHPGCAVGEVSTFYVPRNSMVRIPVGGRLNCHKVCKCGHRNLLTHCRDSTCIQPDSCLVGHGRIQAHNTEFKIGCNRCFCHSAEVICTRRECPNLRTNSQHRTKFTGLPCNCADQYLPVCGINGRTYPSACVARCTGLKDSQFTLGTCSSRNPCKPNPCGARQRCIPRRQTCLTTKRDTCKQHQCISVSADCNPHHHDPVCDTTGEEFTNLCLLYSRNRQLAHHGHCKPTCSSSGKVCGQNGETYSSQCKAWAEGTAVDYPGSCKAVGQLRVNRVDPLCPKVKCPTMERWICKPITPPGTCCPVCGGEVRVLYSQKLADQAVHTARIGPITIKNITSTLSQYVSVPECDIFGYLSIEADLVLMVLPIATNPTALQVQACITEAEKIGSLIKSGSPTLVANLALSPFTTAHTRTAQALLTSGVSGRLVRLNVMWIVTALVVLCTHRLTTWR